MTNPKILAIARAYHSANAGRLNLPPWSDSPATVTADKDAGKVAGLAFHLLPHDPNAPETREAYDALKRETLAQYEHAVANGAVFEPWTKPGQPYANSAQMVEDATKNNHLWYFPTASGFGTDARFHDHPLFEKVPGLGSVRYNDLFRAIHDYYAHAMHGHQFGPTGELRAWVEHARMFSPLARKALTTETHGQNSWVNFGPHEPWKLPQTDRPYADQKAGLLPESVVPKVKLARGQFPVGTEGHTLFDNLRGNAHDATARGILADWLEEHNVPGAHILRAATQTGVYNDEQDRRIRTAFANSGGASGVEHNGATVWPFRRVEPSEGGAFGQAPALLSVHHSYDANLPPPNDKNTNPVWHHVPVWSREHLDKLIADWPEEHRKKIHEMIDPVLPVSDRRAGIATKLAREAPSAALIAHEKAVLAAALPVVEPTEPAKLARPPVVPKQLPKVYTRSSSDPLKIHAYQPQWSGKRWIWAWQGFEPYNEEKHGPAEQMVPVNKVAGKPLTEMQLGILGLAPPEEPPEWRPAETIPEDHYALSRVSQGGMGDAVRAQQSDNHATRLALAKQVLAEAGLAPASVRSVLSHTDARGVRPAVLAAVRNANPKVARFAAAWLGLLLGERRMTVFHPGEGEDTLHVIDSPHAPDHVGEYLKRAGVPSFTLERAGAGTRAFVVNPMHLIPVEQIASGLQGSTQSIQGTAVRLGAGDDKQARDAYRTVIDDSEREAGLGAQPIKLAAIEAPGNRDTVTVRVPVPEPVGNAQPAQPVAPTAPARPAQASTFILPQ